MKKINLDKRLIIGFVVFSFFQIFFVWMSQPDKELKKQASQAMDTFVPLGYTLVPIQIENLAELESLIDNFAIVDLHKKGIHKIIESGVRLLRSPRNAEVFAILIEQEKARRIISEYGAAFTVSLKNPKSQPIQKKPKRIIIKE